MTTPVSFKPVFLVGDKWCDNSQRFATHAEAAASARALFARWTTPTDCAAHESGDPVNYVRVDGVDSHIEEPADVAAD